SALFLPILFQITSINILLAVFNLLPIPPLDGSKVFSLLLPERQAHAYLSLGQFGIFFLLLLLYFPIGGFSLHNIIYTVYLLAQRLLLP
ncbi:MAG: site-2 protease family protein, partial [Candidatus Levybacteria bacterium]|nr:site-2 protease family protein [Candidatus Levybacteria bacterium]